MLRIIRGIDSTFDFSNLNNLKINAVPIFSSYTLLEEIDLTLSKVMLSCHTSSSFNIYVCISK